MAEPRLRASFAVNPRRSATTAANRVRTGARLIEMVFMGSPIGRAGPDPCSRRLEQVRVEFVLELEIAVDALISRAALVPDDVRHPVRDGDAVDCLEVAPNLLGSEFAAHRELGVEFGLNEEVRLLVEEQAPLFGPAPDRSDQLHTDNRTVADLG